ncbi:MAG: multisubunit Na+/H+ antiporter, MnhE subunit [Burkholderiaceae bacterium]|jgi:multisubunit Na+/H+ antiporter MnhE subunit|nr:multisubunit Na+/H+ antiporter, MnhE subunit [Burkholderiaceae bacterium]
MNRLSALIRLAFNFMKEAFVSGGITALIILRGGTRLQPGFVRMSYGDLGETAADFLGALVSLTPGTTTVDIDLERRELLLHVLDVTRAEQTLASIRRDFVLPVRALFGGKP